MCTLHPCPRWGRQEMPASSQESLLRWDFPIYFMKARRPDTGGDKHSRLQVLIVSGSWALQLWPASLLDMQAKIQFGSKSKGLPNWKTVIITHPCQPLQGNEVRWTTCWIFTMGGILAGRIPKEMKRLALHVAAHCNHLGALRKYWGIWSPS